MSGGTNQRVAGRTGPNMTPMVDIVMCILIFFMLGSTFVSAELFLTSRMPARDRSSEGQRGGDIEVRVDLDLTCDADGRSAVRLPVPRLGEALPVGRPDSARDEAERGIETRRNDAIADELMKLREAGLSDGAILVIRPKGPVAYADVIRVYDACMKARFSRVSFAPAR